MSTLYTWVCLWILSDGRWTRRWPVANKSASKILPGRTHLYLSLRLHYFCSEREREREREKKTIKNGDWITAPMASPLCVAFYFFLSLYSLFPSPPFFYELCFLFLLVSHRRSSTRLPPQAQQIHQITGGETPGSPRSARSNPAKPIRTITTQHYFEKFNWLQENLGIK